MEDIREGIARREETREVVYTCISAVRNDRSPQIECLFRSATDNILAYLHSQGVVRKVERELPEYWGDRRKPYTDGEVGYKRGVNDTRKEMLKAGYVAVESLIQKATNK